MVLDTGIFICGTEKGMILGVSKTMPRSPRKTRPAQRTRAPETPVTWPEVLQAIQDTETRSSVVFGFRAAGFTPDQMSLRSAHVALADAITREEDRLEMQVDCSSRRTIRTSLRTIRRRLEGDA